MQPQVFNNRYRIESRLGTGGMAIVYSGTDTLLRRRVAIKVLRDQYALDEDFVKRFSYEAQSAAKLSHPNIVNVYDFGTENDAYYIVMELIDGATLAELIGTDRAIPEPVAIDYAIQIASGLAFAHRQGLLHRDIKPANILITKDDVVKISDFGIARAVSENTMGVTQPGMVMGSVYYLSPEQAQGFAIDETSDLYSLGVVLYQMLTGALPYTADTPVAVALKHVADPVPALDPATTGVSPALASIVTKLLQKDPRARFASATELATALRAAREQPTLTQAVAAGAYTTPGPAAGARNPPPRPSAAPDRPVDRNGTNGSAVTVAGEPAEPAERTSPLRWLVLAVLLLAAVAGGYALIAHPFAAAKPAIAVGDYGDQSSSQAQQAITALGLRPHVVTQTSSTVALDRVIRQDPAPGTKLAADADVTLTVSSGAPLVSVPDVKGYTRTDAERQLTAARFRTTVMQTFDATVPKDTVVGVNPSVGSRAREGSVVALVVSKGRQPVDVPNVVSMSVDAARSALAAKGLRMDIVQQTGSPTIPADTVASQVPSDGSPLDPGSTVQVVISTGPPAANVPDVTGKSAADAASALRGAGFTPVVAYIVDASNASGNVSVQDPVANASGKRGDKVTITISVPGTVPDVSGLSLEDAKRAIVASGYAIGNIADTEDGDEGKVIRTEPEANKETRPGESVEIYFHPASQP